MKILFTLFLFAVVLAPFSAFAEGEDKYYACNDDNDCVIIPHTACQPQTTVNRYSLPYYNLYIANLQMHQDCVPPAGDRLNVIARCFENRCTIALPDSNH